MASQKGLGRGLGALLGDFDQDAAEDSAYKLLPLHRVEPNPDQPRQDFDEEELAALAESIRVHGVLQPLTVRETGGGYYQIIAGERRWRASRMAGLTDVPAIVIEADDKKAKELALIENLQRQDLDFIEEAGGISRLMELGGLSQEQAARLLGKSQSAIANKLRLLRHSEAVLSALRREGLTERHGRALLKLTEEQTKLEAIAQISRQGMSVAQTEKYVQSLLKGKPDAPLRANVGAFLNSLTQSLSRMQSSGIPAVSERRETDSQIVLTITIPKEKA